VIDAGRSRRLDDHNAADGGGHGAGDVVGELRENDAAVVHVPVPLTSDCAARRSRGSDGAGEANVERKEPVSARSAFRCRRQRQRVDRKRRTVRET